MRGWSENDVNNVDVFNEDDYLDAMIENNHEQEYYDNDLSQSMNPSDHISHDPQECLKENRKFSTILSQSFIEDVHKLKYIPQVMNVKNVSYKGMKIQYLQVDHSRVLYYY